MAVRLEEKVVLGVALAFALSAVAGFAVFGVNPGRVTPDLARIYAAAFQVFAQGQVWVTGAAFAYVLTRRVGTRWVVACGACYVISLTAELLGTTYGVPFGAYSYSRALGPMWLERVPVIIPLSWFLMALPSYAIAQRFFEGTWQRIVCGSLLLLAWDLVLDPAMSYVTKYWVWAESGPYFGMPLLNLFGWFVTGLVLLGVLELLEVGRWTEQLPRSAWVTLYAVNVIVPAGMVVAAGLA
jgi:uncharacterized membrane protein